MPRTEPACSPDILDATCAGAADRLLILGSGGAELSCAALRRGCRAAMACAVPPRHPEAADLVVAPRIGSALEAGAVADCAGRALRQGGRLALRLLGEGARATARLLRDRLARDGFRQLRLRDSAGGGLLLTGRRPLERRP